MSDEAILRSFTTDGEGKGEDRKIQSLFQAIRALNTEPSGKNDLVKVECLLRSVEFNFQKHCLISSAISSERCHLAELVKDIEADIIQLKDKIEHVKVELDGAKLVRKNKQEYDTVARQALEKPSREETAESLEKLNASLTDLADTQKILEQKLTEKRARVQELSALLDVFSERKWKPEEEDEDSSPTPDAEPLISDDEVKSDDGEMEQGE